MKVSARAMQQILIGYIKARGLKLRLNRPEEFIRAYHHYCKNIKSLN